MKRATTTVDKIILLCRNVQKTSSIYSESLGLKVYLQSPNFVQLRDKNNFTIYLQQSKLPSQLSKGYSPILSFKIQNFNEVYSKLLRYQLIPDGEIIKIKNSQLATFQGLDGQIITINDLAEEQNEFQEQVKEANVEEDEIKRILQKIKM